MEAWDPDVRPGLQLFSAYPERGTLSPDGTDFVTANGSGVSLYPCDLCGAQHRLTATARTRVTSS